MIPWRYPILFDLIVIGSRQFILFILSGFSPLSIRMKPVVTHSNTGVFYYLKSFITSWM